MVSICVCHTYADVRHMDMLCISFLFTFPGQIRKKVETDLQFRDLMFGHKGSRRSGYKDVRKKSYIMNRRGDGPFSDSGLGEELGESTAPP